MLILVGHDERSLSMQISITKDIKSIVQWVKDFPMISFLCILLLLLESCWCLYCRLWAWLAACYGVSVVGFGQVNAG